MLEGIVEIDLIVLLGLKIFFLPLGQKAQVAVGRPEFRPDLNDFLEIGFAGAVFAAVVEHMPQFEQNIDIEAVECQHQVKLLPCHFRFVEPQEITGAIEVDLRIALHIHFRRVEMGNRLMIIAQRILRKPKVLQRHRVILDQGGVTL